METKVLKVGKLGSEPKEVMVDATMTVDQALEAAGMHEGEYTVYGFKTGQEGNTQLSSSDTVNGYDGLALSVKVKGGCE